MKLVDPASIEVNFIFDKHFFLAFQESVIFLQKILKTSQNSLFRISPAKAITSNEFLSYIFLKATITSFEYILVATFRVNLKFVPFSKSPADTEKGFVSE